MRGKVTPHLATFAVGMLIAAIGAHALAGSSAPSMRMVGGAPGPSQDAEDAPATEHDRRKSYGIYVGSDLTAGGHTLLGGTGDEVSSHWLEIVSAQEHPEDATITVGVTDEAEIPGERTEIPQVERTHKYLTMNYSEWAGFPPPLTNGGLNEHRVAIRDIWSPSREELVEMTPTPQRGPQYSDLARIALQRATTAEEAVRTIGSVIDEHGYSTYGGNSHLIADENEGWVMIEFAGGQGLWVAERLGSDEIRMSYPGYIERVPRDCQSDPDFMCSDDFIDFAVERGWWDPDSGRPFDVNEVYGAQDWDYRTEAAAGKFVAPATIERELADQTPVTLDTFMATVRDPRISSDQSGYGQVAQLREGVPRELGALWVAPTGAVTSPFIPYHIGVTEEPAEYRQHRYLTKNAASTYLNPAYAPQEATRFAGRLFKRLMYHTCTHPRRFYPEVREALTGFEGEMREERSEVEETARVLLEAGKGDLARRYLTEYSHGRAAEAMELGEALVESVEARAKLSYGIPEPPESQSINGGGFEEGDFVTCHRAENGD